MTTREGSLFKRLEGQPADQSWAPFYYILAGSHLYEYQSKSGSPLKTISLTGATVVPTDEAAGNGANDTVSIIANGKALTLRCDSQEIRDEWNTDLQEATTTSRSVPAPVLDEPKPVARRRKGSVSMRAEKKLVDTAMKTKKGREKLKNMIPAESAAMYALNAFTEFTQVDQDADSAQKYERSVLKVIVKAMVLDKYKMLDADEISKGLNPLAELCRQLSQVNKGDADLDQASLIALSNELCGVAVCVLTPHVTPKTIATMQSVFDYVRNDNRFEKLLTLSEHTEARSLAMKAMELALPNLEAEIAEREMKVDARDKAAMAQQATQANSKVAKMLGMGAGASA